MKRNYLFLIAFIVLISLLSSCNSKKSEVKKFVLTFSEAVAQHDTLSINNLYPLASTCDSLCSFSEKDGISIEESDTPDKFIAKIGDKELTIVFAEDGTMSITDSRNILNYPQSQISFGLATGWIEKGMSDAEMAERFADEGFVSYLSESLSKELANNLRVSGWEYSMHPMEMSAMGDRLKHVPLQFIVVNNTPYDIAAEDYVIEIVVNYLRVAGVGDQKMEVNGESLSANSKTKVKYNLKPVYGDPNLFQDIVRHEIVLKAPAAEILQKYFIPKGGEYQTYLYSKNKK
ncbi:MAG: hypothetical protein J5671_09615 [Bacteroidaceae bacterium]|nr:hypothetical protein [Bacteroidaceae bacterium]